jgi:hypothetical protein
MITLMGAEAAGRIERREEETEACEREERRGTCRVCVLQCCACVLSRHSDTLPFIVILI